MAVVPRLDLPPLRRGQLVESKELHERRERVHWNDSDLPRRIERETTPVRTTDVRRPHQRTLKARRRERTFISQRRDLIEARLPPLRVDAPDIAGTEPPRPWSRG